MRGLRAPALAGALPPTSCAAAATGSGLAVAVIAALRRGYDIPAPAPLRRASARWQSTTTTRVSTAPPSTQQPSAAASTLAVAVAATPAVSHPALHLLSSDLPDMIFSWSAAAEPAGSGAGTADRAPLHAVLSTPAAVAGSSKRPPPRRQPTGAPNWLASGGTLSPSKFAAALTQQLRPTPTPAAAAAAAAGTWRLPPLTPLAPLALADAASLVDAAAADPGITELRRRLRASAAHRFDGDSPQALSALADAAVRAQAAGVLRGIVADSAPAGVLGLAGVLHRSEWPKQQQQSQTQASPTAGAAAKGGARGKRGGAAVAAPSDANHRPAARALALLVTDLLVAGHGSNGGSPPLLEAVGWTPEAVSLLVHAMRREDAVTLPLVTLAAGLLQRWLREFTATPAGGVDPGAHLPQLRLAATAAVTLRSWLPRAVATAHLPPPAPGDWAHPPRDTPARSAALEAARRLQSPAVPHLYAAVEAALLHYAAALPAGAHALTQDPPLLHALSALLYDAATISYGGLHALAASVAGAVDVRALDQLGNKMFVRLVASSAHAATGGGGHLPAGFHAAVLESTLRRRDGEPVLPAPPSAAPALGLAVDDDGDGDAAAPSRRGSGGSSRVSLHRSLPLAELVTVLHAVVCCGGGPPETHLAPHRGALDAAMRRLQAAIHSTGLVEATDRVVVAAAVAAAAAAPQQQQRPHRLMAPVAPVRLPPPALADVPLPVAAAALGELAATAAPRLSALPPMSSPQWEGVRAVYKAPDVPTKLFQLANAVRCANAAWQASGGRGQRTTTAIDAYQQRPPHAAQTHEFEAEVMEPLAVPPPQAVGTADGSDGGTPVAPVTGAAGGSSHRDTGRVYELGERIFNASFAVVVAQAEAARAAFATAASKPSSSPLPLLPVYDSRSALHDVWALPGGTAGSGVRLALAQAVLVTCARRGLPLPVLDFPLGFGGQLHAAWPDVSLGLALEGVADRCALPAAVQAAAVDAAADDAESFIRSVDVGADTAARAAQLGVPLVPVVLPGPGFFPSAVGGEMTRSAAAAVAAARRSRNFSVLLLRVRDWGHLAALPDGDARLAGAVEVVARAFDAAAGSMARLRQLQARMRRARGDDVGDRTPAATQPVEAEVAAAPVNGAGLAAAVTTDASPSIGAATETASVPPAAAAAAPAAASPAAAGVVTVGADEWAGLRSDVAAMRAELASLRQLLQARGGHGQ